MKKYFNPNLYYRMSQLLRTQQQQKLKFEQQKNILSSFSARALFGWDFELSYRNRTVLINASSEIDEIGFIEYSHDYSKFYIHGYTCTSFERSPSDRVLFAYYFDKTRWKNISRKSRLIIIRYRPYHMEVGVHRV